MLHHVNSLQVKKLAHQGKRALTKFSACRAFFFHIGKHSNSCTLVVTWVVPSKRSLKLGTTYLTARLLFCIDALEAKDDDRGMEEPFMLNTGMDALK